METDRFTSVDVGRAANGRLIMPSKDVDYYLERTVYMVRNGATEEMPRALNLEFDGYLADLEDPSYLDEDECSLADMHYSDSVSGS
jgi:hypothetical protein